MKVKLNVKGTYRKSKQAKEDLNLYGKEAKAVLLFLAKQFGFKPPKVRAERVAKPRA